MYLDCWILSTFWISLGKGRVVGGSVGVALVLAQRHGASEASSSYSSSQCRLSMAVRIRSCCHGHCVTLHGGLFYAMWKILQKELHWTEDSLESNSMMWLCAIARDTLVHSLPPTYFVISTHLEVHISGRET